MGWKNVKEHYRIGHIVHVTSQGICIGSPYIHNLIVVSPDGIIKKPYEGNANSDLMRYMAEMRSDPAKLRELATTPDSFAKSVAVYTYDGGSILEKQCEEVGWPNVTHDGCLQYANTFSADRYETLKRAIVAARSEVEAWKKILLEREASLAEGRSLLLAAADNLIKLESL